MKKFQLSDFDYELPEEYIAQTPLQKRTSSRLLFANKFNYSIQHHQFPQLIDFVSPGDVMIFNDTKVIPARLKGHKNTGGKIECLIERILTEKVALAHIRSSKSPKIGSLISLAEGAIDIKVLDRKNDLFLIEFLNDDTILNLLHQHGQIPLPPYIKREEQAVDHERYQTIYAEHLGAVAAPTAGLHFDQLILNQLKQKGVNLQHITLHVGAGTFQPIRTCLEQHEMHEEYFKISPEVCQVINSAREKGGRIIAVGTTVVRCLESAALSGVLTPHEGITRLFIQPGFDFKIVDALLTNFHLPKSTLLILVSAFAGYEFTIKCYQEAVQSAYRFFSYGDAMFISG